MAFVTKEEFVSHIDTEIMDLISRADDAIVIDVLEVAKQIAGSYLGRFDVDVIFASTGADKEKYAALIMYIKDIAKWHFIKKVNPNINLELAKTAYDDAIKELGKIQAGKVTPMGWTIKEQPENKIGQFSISSRPKRGNYY